MIEHAPFSDPTCSGPVQNLGKAFLDQFVEGQPDPSGLLSTVSEPWPPRRWAAPLCGAGKVGKLSSRSAGSHSGAPGPVAPDAWTSEGSVSPPV